VARAKPPSSPPRALTLRRDPVRAAEFANLRYVNPDERGYSRRRRGRGFAYYDKRGELIGNPQIKARIAKLAIPPAWTDVWICANPRGHVQATGYDERSRKQYIYHADWVAVRDRAKFSALPAFGRALPNIRQRVAEDLELEEFVFEKAVATVIRFMDDTLIRVGNQRYTRANSTFGLTTLRKRHVEIEQHEVCLDYVGKGGKRINFCVEDPELAELARQCVEIPGYQLFKYYDERGRRRRVESHHVNAYLQAAAEAPFTAKDFRTWSATTTAAETLWETGSDADSQRARKSVVTAMVEYVAEQLHNTPAVCRGSYIHPQVIESYMDGMFIPHYERALEHAIAQPVEHLDTAEGALLKFCETPLVAARS
jgi:DNA topoisomerase-1